MEFHRTTYIIRSKASIESHTSSEPAASLRVEPNLERTVSSDEYGLIVNFLPDSFAIA